MAAQEGKYNIKAISNMVDIQPGTLRAWERRYQILNPVRNDSGHRLYTEEDFKKLKWLTEKVNSGFTISQAVSLLETESTSVSHEDDDKQADSPQRIKEELLQALLSFEESKAQDLISHAFSLYSVEKVVMDVLGSCLVKIGDMWEKGSITSAHEHYASQLLKARISMIFYSLPSNGLLPKTIAVCGPGETHEVGLLIFTFFLRRKGFEVIYLGSSIEEKDLPLIVKEVNPTFLFMSCTMADNAVRTLEIASDMKEQFPDMKVGLGGYAFDMLDKERREKAKPFVLGHTKDSWNQWLNEKLAELEG
ncbi:MerR family transcriptional regulator [Metabacillus iocasae]|uniref:Methanogenic corrinoid protein MtbC1 n=1 Tax=Priestia iocasae TaxID=2291674 RepID=A0ABS2QQG1_9BACI|nr:B12-binding domain-containing protein [Metabacillus iocasae]MBM7701695.1 methanogenic corrinoid protein MtbC1 [Metabacillus iocasae]